MNAPIKMKGLCPDDQGFDKAGQCGRSLQLLELCANLCGRQWKVSAVFNHLLLSLPTQDVTQELLQLRVDRMTRRAIEVDKDAARQRVGPALEILPARLVVRSAFLSRQGQRLHLREILGVMKRAVGD